jgi:aminopeptidase
MLPNFQQHLQAYAEVIVKIGLNLRPGQRLVITSLRTDGAPLETAPLVRAVAQTAYQHGARYVDVIWSDDQLRLTRFQAAPPDSFAEYAAWHTDLLRQHTDRGDAVLNLTAENPTLLNSVNPDQLAVARRSMLQHATGYYDNVMRNAMNWLVAGASVSGWAAKVFADAPAEEQVDRLWDAIFRICRVYEPDPIAAWQRHLADLKARSAYLNRKGYSAVRFRGPGTDLTVGLVKRHIWMGGSSVARNGIDFTANVPTEEVWTMPHRRHTEGVVRAALPLNYGGVLIEDFSVEFEHGRVVGFSAGKNEAALRKLVETDEGSSRLGEVALAPQTSPIAQSGRLFFNTLYDENAASHIALGRAYRFNLEGGEAMPLEDALEAGCNTSLEHVDFMIGSAAMDVDGLSEGGVVEAVMRGGVWAFEI